MDVGVRIDKRPTIEFRAFLKRKTEASIELDVYGSPLDIVLT